MLTVQNLSKSFGADTILKNVSFSVSSGERLGLVGPNGGGKSTLLRILTGYERCDTGVIHFASPSIRIGYLPQGYDPSTENLEYPETIRDYLARKEGNLDALSERVEELAAAWAKEPDRKDLAQDYDHALSLFQAASESADRGPTILSGLGLGDMDPNTPVSHLSGGQKTRLALTGVLLSNPQLLLLDEPTNHLDLEMLAWLENWLLGYQNAALIVSHDRIFLDRTVTGILELDTSTQTIIAYPGNYSDYLEQKLSEQERHMQEYSDQVEEIQRLRAAAARVRNDANFKRGGKGDSGDKFAKGFFANRTKGTVNRAKNIEKRIEHLLTDERVEKPRQSWQMKLEFGDTPTSGKDVLMLSNLSVGYGDHVLLSKIDLHVRQGGRIVVVGPNGTGKTTLLKTIAGKIPPLEGNVRLGANVQLGYMAQEQENLSPEMNALMSLRQVAAFSETDARSFLHKYLFAGDDVFTPVGRLSYGERARLSLACLVASGCNLLLLDEPINHLDIPARARFEAALANFPGTILAVVHDRYFIESFASEIWEVIGSSIARIERG